MPDCVDAAGPTIVPGLPGFPSPLTRMAPMSGSPPSDSVETPFGWVVVAASLVFITVSFGTSYILTVSLKTIAAEFDWPRWVPSAAYATMMLGSGMGGIVMGHWADRAGVWKPATLGALMVGGGAIAASFAESAVYLIAICGLFMGFLGNSAAVAPMMTNITRWFDRRRGLAVSIVASGQALAGGTWPILFNHGLETLGWRTTWQLYGVAAICLMLPMVLALRFAPPREIVGGRWTVPATGLALRVEVPPVVLLALLSFAIVGCCVAMAMPMVHLVAYCTDLGFSAADGAAMLTVLLLCSAVSRLGFGFLSDRIGGLTTILIGSAMQASALGLFALVDTVTGLYAVSGLFGLVFGGIVPAYALAVRELFPARQSGSRMGVVFFFGTIGMALGGLLGGWIFDLAGSYHLAFLVGVGFNITNLMAIVTLLWLKGPARPERAFA
jgi:MFS family permease